jgi:hypothetical protein
MPVQTGTFASRAFASAAIPNQPQEVPASLWSSDLAEDAKVCEHSKALQAYSSVISLLWRQP